MAKSIISNEKVCYLCGSWHDLQRHHAIHGWANRKLAEDDGLWVWLCMGCHAALHDHGTNDNELKATAETAWLEATGGTVEDFRKRYGKSFL